MHLHSKRLFAVLTRALHGHRNIQATCRWRSLPKFSAGDVHYIPGCQSWVGQCANSNVCQPLYHSTTRSRFPRICLPRSMLYHLLTLNPNKDFTLHVSANNPAMVFYRMHLIIRRCDLTCVFFCKLLYNRFGFKAEEFVAGFYEDYLDPQSRASKNAFRLRLRR